MLSLVFLMPLQALPSIEKPSQDTRGLRRAVRYLEREVPKWQPAHDCFSCHNNGDGARALYRARQRGLSRAPLERTTAWLVRPHQWNDNGPDGPFSDRSLARLQFALAQRAAHRAGIAIPKPALERAALFVAKDQAEDGSFGPAVQGVVGDPATYGRDLATALAIRFLRDAAEPVSREAVLRGERFLMRSEPRNVVRASAYLLGMKDAKPSKQRDMRLAQALQVLAKGQGEDGGFGPFVSSPGEAFDTALALWALSERPPTKAISRQIEQAIAFLKRVQCEDGSYVETTRPRDRESYAQRISTTAWVVWALLAGR